jgi:uncharacterized membrane protein
MAGPGRGRGWRRLTASVRLRQWHADLFASFWLRPAAVTLLAVALAELLVRSEGRLGLPPGVSGWVYAGGETGARHLLGAVATAAIGVAGTTFSITVAALTLASNQMGPRLLRNFSRDPGNQYALGAFLATFAYALTVLRTVHDTADEAAFVPKLAVSVGLLLALVCVGVLIWFLHHLANSINVTHVVALVHRDLAAALARLPRRGAAGADQGGGFRDDEFADAAALPSPGAGYLRALDDDALADWAAAADAKLRLRLRPGDFVFPHATVGEVVPAALAAEAKGVLAGAMSLGDSRDVEQDPEFAVRQLVEVALRALSPSLNDPFTAIAVLDRFGAALCDLARRDLRDGCGWRDGVLRVQRPATDYAGLVDAMLHMIRESGAGSPAVMIRLLEVLAEVARVETARGRRGVLRRHVELAAAAAGRATADPGAAQDLAGRTRRALDALEEAG